MSASYSPEQRALILARYRGALEARAGYGLGGAESRHSDAGRSHRIAMSQLAKLRGPGTGASQVHRYLCLPDTYHLDHRRHP